MAMDDAPKPHFVLVPLMAQGHMIPMADFALLLVSRGSRVSLITTPVNARRLRAVANRGGDNLRLVELSMPCAEFGLPEGCENVDLVRQPELFIPFFNCIRRLEDQLNRYLREQPPAPTCIIADQCMPWTMEVANDLGIPRFVFHCPSCFYLLCTLRIAEHELYEKVSDPCEAFFVPGLPQLPQRIEVNKLKAQRFLDVPDLDLLRHVQEADATADGIVLNTCYEFEPWCVDDYRGALGKEVWPVGPVSLIHKDTGGKVVRGDGSAGVDHSGVSQWLDGREPGSVLFISFGSIARTLFRQQVEIGNALEATGRPFLWAMKEAEKGDLVEEWLAEFEERNRGNGIIVKGWVPQVLILTHPAVGCFMTHCGWNSTLEAVAAGVPMVTWPHFADQFLNEKLVVDILRTGVSVGVKAPFFYMAAGDDALVKSEAVERAVESIMGGVEGEKIRRRARKFAEKASKVMEEGGSSKDNLDRMIDYTINLATGNYKANGRATALC
ncbi:hypothetical protein HPP92_008664 [Vanilla planifolia]|uniref:Glycosyltransferase n=1 Tax=Vanilla planifolia TaxID=51239 RepID=A0A835V5L2_VANPL|nr:hypothetical protein HPP92_008664 [Vanilla planifolia]